MSPEPQDPARPWWQRWQQAITVVASVLLANGVVLAHIKATAAYAAQRAETMAVRAANIESIPEIKRRLDEAAVRHVALADNVVAAIWETDPQGKCVYANYALANLFGAGSPSQFLSLDWLQFIQRDQQRRVYDAWMNALQSGRPYEDEYTLYNGRTIRVSGRAYKDRDGKPVMWGGVAELVTTNDTPR